MRQGTFVSVRRPFFSPFNDIFNDFERELETKLAGPPASTQLLENENGFFISYDMPGINFSDINIELDEDYLSISADRKNPFDKEGGVIKKYTQTYMLPKNIDKEKINAHYENGVLSLTIPKIEESKTKKKIQVLTGEKPKTWSNFLSFKKTEAGSLAN